MTKHSNRLFEKIYGSLHDYFLPDTKQEKQTLTHAKDLLVIFTGTCVVSALILNFVSYFLAGIPLTEKNSHAVPNSLLYFDETSSYPIVQKNIMSRNLFNLTGEIPYEDTQQGSHDYFSQYFEQAPCSWNEKLPVELVGIIYTGNSQTNLVSLKDPAISLVDVYKEGQKIIDHNDFTLYKVTNSSSAQFKNGHKKVCVSLRDDQPQNNTDPDQVGEFIVVTTRFVQEQIGAGFSKIINAARLVPHLVDGQTTGFQIFNIQKNSLFDKIHLQNQDIIKKINGVTLTNAAEGFKLYEAFQTENKITLEIERNGAVLNKKVSVQ